MDPFHGESLEDERQRLMKILTERNNPSSEQKMWKLFGMGGTPTPSEGDVQVKIEPNIIDEPTAEAATITTVEVKVEGFPPRRTTKCVNPKCSKKSSYQSISMCSECFVWLHYKCIDRRVWDGKECEGANECIFCKQLENLAPKTDLPMRHESKINPAASRENAKEGCPVGPISSWNCYWNINHVSSQFHIERNFKVGEFVYVLDPVRNTTVLWQIEFLIRDLKGDPWAKVIEYCHPENIRKDFGKKFFANETMIWWDRTNPAYASLNDIRGPPAWVASRDEYLKYTPLAVSLRDRYIERYYYDPKRKKTLPAKKGDFRTNKTSTAVEPRAVPLSKADYPPLDYDEDTWIKFNKNYSTLQLF